LEKAKAMYDAKTITKKEYEELRQRILKEGGTTSSAAPAAEESFFCNYVAADLKGQVPDDLGHSWTPDPDVMKVVKDLTEIAGLATNYVVRPAFDEHQVPTAAAIVRGATRYVEYNQRFIDEMMKSGGKWSEYAVLAHELGHHLAGHTLLKGGSRPDLELEADSYSGFLLSQLGATLGDAQLALQQLAPEGASKTHPARSQRMKAVENGYRRGLDKKKPPPVPTVKPDQDAQQGRCVEQCNREEQRCVRKIQSFNACLSDWVAKCLGTCGRQGFGMQCPRICSKTAPANREVWDGECEDSRSEAEGECKSDHDDCVSSCL
jgi:hypothetical protein